MHLSVNILKTFIQKLTLLSCVSLMLLPQVPMAQEGKSKSASMVTLNFSANVKAEVYHGSKLLGVTPFSIQKKKGPPMDLIFKASGHLPVSTRAYTHMDDRVSVEMTAIGKENTLFGYKKRIEGVDEKELENMD